MATSNSNRNRRLNQGERIRRAVLALCLVASGTALGLTVESRYLHLQLLSAAPGPSEGAGLLPVAATTEPRPEELRRAAFANALAKRYRVSQDPMTEYVSAAFDAAKATRMDPMLLLAVIAIESRFNPVSESVMGAKGLMQIIPAMHPDKFNNFRNDAEILDPEANILAGAKALKEYEARGGDLIAGLQIYAGAAADTANQYATKVLSERDRIQEIFQRVPTPRPATSAAAAQRAGNGSTL